LRQGAQLVIFPEGSRTVDFPLDPFAPGMALIAWRSATPVQTVLIEFSTPYLGKAWPLFRRPSLPLTCRIRLGRRFPPPGNYASFSDELETWFRSELGQKNPSTATASS
jgi:1-acyl-sn-glycerol-3-phosphate acyltransferase